MTVICWNDPMTGEARYEDVPGSAEKSLEIWQDSHPGLSPTHRFLLKDDMVSGGDEQKLRFECACHKYGLMPADFGAPLLLNGGNPGIVSGVEPRRRKYVIRVWDKARQATVLMSPEGVKQGMRRYQTAIARNP